LYGIAANLVMKHHRARARRDRSLERLAIVQPDRSRAAFDDVVVDGDANAALIDLVSRAIETMADTDREVVLLYAWQELSYAEIAEAMGIPIGTVRSRLNRVRSTLRELTGHSGKDPDNPTHRVQGGTSR
ncbi:MAG: RNA polymerase sigma factor, partial [Desertimonas sp.]